MKLSAWSIFIDRLPVVPPLCSHRRMFAKLVITTIVAFQPMIIGPQKIDAKKAESLTKSLESSK